MTKDHIFRIAINLNKIALIVDQVMFNRIKPYLQEIENVVKRRVKYEIYRILPHHRQDLDIHSSDNSNTE